VNQVRRVFHIRRTHLCRAGAGYEFGFIQLVVAANQHEERLAVGDENERLDLTVGGDAVRRLAERLDGDDAGRGKLFDSRRRCRGPRFLGMPLVAFSMFAA
jgi:hypothetical protein